MGGAIAVHAAGGALLPSVVGLVTIDVVEGEKLSTETSMSHFLNTYYKGILLLLPIPLIVTTVIIRINTFI